MENKSQPLSPHLQVYRWHIFDYFKNLRDSIENINSREAARIIYSDIEKGMEQIEKSLNK